jgi:hypothetical protein
MAASAAIGQPGESPFRPGQSGNPAGGRKLARHTWPRARNILHKLVLTSQPKFEQKLAKVMLTKKGALRSWELLAKLNREIGSRSDEALR